MINFSPVILSCSLHLFRFIGCNKNKNQNFFLILFVSFVSTLLDLTISLFEHSYGYVYSLQFAIQWNVCVYAKPSQTKYISFWWCTLLCICGFCAAAYIAFYVFFFYILVFFSFDWNFFFACFFFFGWVKQPVTVVYRLSIHIYIFYFLPWISVCHFLLCELFKYFLNRVFNSLNSEWDFFFCFF